MNIIPIKLEEMEKPIILELGFAGENMCTGFSFACDSVFSEYPDAIPSMAVTPPKGSKYPVVVTRDGNNVLWNITDSDTAYMGSGEVQLIFTQNNVVKRSYTCRTRILKSILAEGTPPDPVQSWIDSANEMLAEIPETIDVAIDTAIAAAKASGEFKGDPGFSPVVTTAPITGGNSVTITDEQGEHSFNVLNGANGVSPDLSVTPFTGGHRITIVDASGTNTFDVTNGVDATPDLITVDYANLTFPVAKGATCYHNGQMFEAKVAIQTSEEWDSTKWDPRTVEEQIGSVLTAIQGTNDNLNAIAENGFYKTGIQQIYYDLLKGQINSDTSNPIGSVISTSVNDCGYIIIPKDNVPTGMYFDNTKYKVNTVFVKNGYEISGTYKAWQSTSPVQYTEPSDWDAIGINVKKLNGNYETGELKTAFYKNDTVTIGKLATKEYVESYKRKGVKCIYPDSFESRIKPDIYFDGCFFADLDISSYKIIGSGEVWVATNGNDTTGDGTENNPFATITKALTQSAVTIHIKEGTYTQGTHYTTSCNLAGKNVIGHGTVIFQNDASGHYAMVNASAYIENIIFKHGNATTNSAFAAICAASGQCVCFVGCTFRDSGSNGLGVDGIDAVLVDCVAYGNKLDGFNYHARTVSSVTYIPNVIEIDCKAYNNGSDQSGSDSCNGSTSHDGTKIIRLNGEYYSCYGGVIAEIALAGEEPTISVNFGVLAHDSTGTGTYKASFWASVNTKMYLYDCSCYGGTYDISAINDALVVSRRLTTGRDVPAVNEAETATVYQY